MNAWKYQPRRSPKRRDFFRLPPKQRKRIDAFRQALRRSPLPIAEACAQAVERHGVSSPLWGGSMARGPSTVDGVIWL